MIFYIYANNLITTDIDDFIKPASCESCRLNGFICSNTPLHLSFIFATENKWGKMAAAYYKLAKVQNMVLKGAYDKLLGNLDKKLLVNPFYQGLAYRAGFINS